MTNTDRVLAEIARSPGASDGELVKATGIEPHQQVNQICRRLAESGRTERRPRADGKLGNYPAARDASPATTASHLPPPPPRPVTSRQSVSQEPPAGVRPAPAGARRVADLPPAHLSLIVFPCSGAKQRGGQADLTGPSVLDGLQPATAAQLAQARASVAAKAGLDERALMPAVERYSGFLYESATDGLQQSLPTGQRFVILSGGYGLLHPHEPIGTYDRAFTAGDWPPGLLETALLEITKRCELTNVVAFCAATTGYAKVIRRTPWARKGIDAFLVTPSPPAGVSVRQEVPRASGEALAAYVHGRLSPGWTSRAGLPLSVEELR